MQTPIPSQPYRPELRKLARQKRAIQQLLLIALDLDLPEADALVWADGAFRFALAFIAKQEKDQPS